MKIAIVVPGGLHPSGTEQIVPSWLRLFEQLAKTHEIHAFVLKHLSTPQSYSLRGFTVHDLGRPSSALGVARWAQERALLKALDAYRPFDLVHGFFADPSGLLAARAGERLGIPSIVTCDSGEFVALPVIRYGSQRTRRGRRAVLEACALAARVHVCTQFMAALATAHDVKTTIIPLTSVTSETAAARQLSRPAGDASFRLVQVASLSRVKNQRLLLDALAIVRKRIDARLDLIGEDTLGGELQKHTAAIGLEPYVTFHGFLRHECVLEILATSDLYVQSSLHEAAGVSVLEAAAAGVPTVGTLAGLVADWSPSKAVGVGAATAASLDYPNYELGTGPRTTEPRNLRTLAERLLSCGAAQLAERMARTLYSWHLTRKSATWFSRDQVRLERECLKLHTSSHRWSTLEKFDRAMADATTKFAKRAAAVDVLAS